jgi:molybdenum cofactor cytidylyltransferase
VVARAAPRIDVVENLDFARGMGSSLATGIRHLVAESEAAARPLDGALVVPGDLVRITAAEVEAVLAAFEAAGGRAIVHAATADGGQRHPVVWPERFLAALAALDGEAGGKALMDAERRRGPGAVVAVALCDDRLADVDTPRDLADRGSS